MEEGVELLEALAVTVTPITTVGVALGEVSTMPKSCEGWICAYRNPSGLGKANGEADGALDGELVAGHDDLPGARSHGGEGDAAGRCDLLAGGLCPDGRAGILATIGPDKDGADGLHLAPWADGQQGTWVMQWFGRLRTLKDGGKAEILVRPSIDVVAAAVGIVDAEAGA